MAALQPGVVSTILRKDFLSLWPLVGGSLLLPLSIGLNSWLEMPEQGKIVLLGLGVLSTIILAVTIIQQDSTIVPRHDWLTRPIGLANLGLAKLIFLSLSIALPIYVGLVIHQLGTGHSLDEAWLASLAALTGAWMAALPLVVLALVTRSLVEAGVVFFGLVILRLLVTMVIRPPGLIDGGAQWIQNLFTGALNIAFCAAAIWLLFGRKKPAAARATFIAGAVLTWIAASYVPHSWALSLQQRLSPTPDTGALQVAVSALCVEAPSSPKEVIDPMMRNAEIVVKGLPAGSIAVIDAPLHAEFIGPDGQIKGRAAAWAKDINQPQAIVDGQRARLRTHTEPALADARKLRWAFGITTLTPKVTRDLPLDGRRRFLPGLGYCQANLGPKDGAAFVSCFKPFSAPATLSAEIVGQPNSLCVDCSSVNYQPALMDGFGKSLRTGTNPIEGLAMEGRTVRLTAYEVTAHLTRTATRDIASANALAICPAAPRNVERTIVRQGLAPAA